MVYFIGPPCKLADSAVNFGANVMHFLISLIWFDGVLLCAHFTNTTASDGWT